MSGRRLESLSLAILALGVSAFHYRGIAPGRTFLAVDLSNNNLPWLSGPPLPMQNWLISDPIYQTYPFLLHAVDSARRGEWPLWNPHILMGHPSFADPLAQSFYAPFLLLGLLVGAARGLAIGLWIHAVLAAFLTHGLLRAIGCPRRAAVAGGFCYALGGYMVAWFETAFWISTLSWLPGVLWSFELARGRRSILRVGAGGLMFGLSILGGQVAFAATFALFFVLYAAGRAVESALHFGRPWRWDVATAAGILAVGGLLGGVQMLPFVEFLGLSHRSALSGALDPLPIEQLIGLVVPNFFGNPATTVDYWGKLNFSEAAAYAGLPALLLAILAPLTVRSLFSTYLSVIALGIVLFAVGAPGVALVTSIPPLSYLSLHRSIFLLPLLIAMLAAMAMGCPSLRMVVAGAVTLATAGAVGLAIWLNPGVVEAHRQALEPEFVRVATLLLSTLALLAARGRSPRWFLPADGALVALLFLDLFSFGHSFNPAGRIDGLMLPTPAVRYLQAHPDRGRVALYQRGDQLLVGPNVISVFGIDEAGGYSSLVPARLQRLVDAGDPKREARGIGYYLGLNRNIVFFSNPSRRLLDLLGVERVVSPSPPDGLKEVYRGEAGVYDLVDPLPRARVVYGAQLVPDDDRAVARLLDDGFDLSRIAVVAEPVSLPDVAELPSTPAEITDRRDGVVAVKVAVPRAGLLILTDQHHPGWQAYLDGRPVPLVRANLISRGVEVPAGEHVVEFRFEPASLRLGALMSAAGVAALLAMVVSQLRSVLPTGQAALSSSSGRLPSRG